MSPHRTLAGRTAFLGLVLHGVQPFLLGTRLLMNPPPIALGGIAVSTGFVQAPRLPAPEALGHR